MILVSLMTLIYVMLNHLCAPGGPKVAEVEAVEAAEPLDPFLRRLLVGAVHSRGAVLRAAHLRNTEKAVDLIAWKKLSDCFVIVDMARQK